MQSGADMNSTKETDLYAEQWIAFLRKRNTILNIVWPILLTLLAASGLSAVYFYQLHLVSQQELKNVQTELVYSKSEYAYLQADFNAMKDFNDKLSAELESLKNDKANLSEQQSDSVSQLDLTSKMVTALTAQVGVLNDEKKTMTEAIQEAKALLIQQKRVNTENLTKNSHHIKQVTAKLNKQLSNRKVAYQALAKRQHEMQLEMDRLVSVISKQKSEINLVKASKNEMKSNFVNSTEKYNALYNQYQALDKKLKLIMSPIASSESSEATKSNDFAGSGQGLEEIKTFSKPPKISTKLVEKKESSKTQNKVKSKQSANFDYDKISIN